MNTMRKFAALVAAGALLMAIAGTASADPVWATVTGHMASTSDNNNPDWWETFDGGFDECTKLDAGEGDLGSEVDTYVLSASWELVIVKAGSSKGDDPNSLTLFADASAGETVWADHNPDGVFGDGDKNISHIIFCDEVTTTTTTTTEETTTTTEETTTTTEETTTTTEETTTTTEETTTTTTEETTTTTTFTQDTGGETDAPTLPPTSTSGGGASGPSDASWLLVAALGVLLAGAVILTPARVTSRR